MTRLSLSAIVFGTVVTVLAIGGVFIGVYYEGPTPDDDAQSSSGGSSRTLEGVDVGSLQQATDILKGIRFNPSLQSANAYMESSDLKENAQTKKASANGA